MSRIGQDSRDEKVKHNVPRTNKDVGKVDRELIGLLRKRLSNARKNVAFLEELVVDIELPKIVHHENVFLNNNCRVRNQKVMLPTRSKNYLERSYSLQQISLQLCESLRVHMKSEMSLDKSSQMVFHSKYLIRRIFKDKESQSH